MTPFTPFLLLLLQAAPAQEPPKEEFPKWSVGGSLSTSVGALHSTKHNRDTMPEEGVVGEFALGGTLHAARGLSMTMRVCVGCHEFEAGAAYVDVDLSESFTFRAGRMPVPFGAMSQRTDAGHRESTSKPLPYIMGRMVRQDEFNLGIVPGPVVDTGASLRGNVWLGSSLQLGIEAALIRGFEGTSPEIDYANSREIDDNNGEPAGAGRLTLAAGAVTLGVSGMVGHYDVETELLYGLAGADLHVGIEGWNLRVEGLMRRTDYLDAASEEDDARRYGWAIQLDAPVTDDWRLFVLQDGLRIDDLYITAGGPLPLPLAATDDDENAVGRLVGGFVWSARAGLQVKGSVEYWDFSDFDDARVFQLEVVAEY